VKNLFLLCRKKIIGFMIRSIFAVLCGYITVTKVILGHCYSCWGQQT